LETEGSRAKRRAVLATYGDTTVIANRRRGQGTKVGLDFLPLTSTIRRNSFAAGRIPGGYFKREGRRPRRKRSPRG